MKAKAYIAAISSVINESIKQACLDLGLETITLNKKENLLEEIFENKPKIIFLQASMLEESEKNLISLIKENNELGNTHIIVHSVSLDGADYAYQNGADAFLPIPFRQEQLESILRYALNLPKKLLMIRTDENGDSPLYKSLSDNSFSILIANGMDMGINITKMAYPDIIICDLELEDGSAPEFCSRLRDLKLFYHIPVMVLSLKDDVDNVERCFEAGAQDILLSPFDSKENIKKITSVVSPHTMKKQVALVVDDSMVIRNLIANMFKQLGFMVLTAKDGIEGLEIAKKEKPDLITSDYDMPRLDGWGFCSELKKIDETKNIPVIMVTSRDADVDMKKAKVLGLSSYLTKPFNINELKSAVKNAIEESQRQKEHEQLSKYVAKDALENVEKIVQRGKSLEPEEKFITIFFSDICGFSTMCERLSTAKIVELLNNYFEKMSEILQNNNAIIDKFIGDAIVARFDSGDIDKDALNSCTAAMNMLEGLKELNKSSEEEIKIRIGINSGNAILGNLGSTRSRLDYTMIGDNVNIAQRLESAAPNMGCLISHSTYELICDKLEVDEMLQLKVKGRKEEVVAYPLLSIKKPLN